MVFARHFLFFLLIPLGLFAQYPAVDVRSVVAQGQMDGGASPGSIDGRVSNAQTGDGVAGATIRLAPMRMSRSGAADAKTTTASDGSFHFDGVAPGAYFAIVESKGFVANGSRAALHPVSVSSGQQVSNVNIALTPQAIISGKVLDDNGTGQSGARIEAYTEHLIRGKMQLYRVAQSTANGTGDYTVTGLSPGKYYLMAEPPQPNATKAAAQPPTQTGKTAGAANAETSTDQPAVQLVRTYYPKALDLDSAGTIEVQSGQDQTGTDIQLRRVATHHLRGKVDGLSKPGAPRDSLFLAQKAGLQPLGFGRRGKLAADGSFDFENVVPGQYTLRLIGTDNNASGSSRFMSRRLLAQQDVEIGASDVDGVELAVIPPITITGRVSVDGMADANLSQVHVTLAPAADDMGYGTYQNAQAAADGSFSLQNLSPAKYVVHAVGGPAGTYLKSLTFNGQDLLTDTMDLSGGSGGELAVVFHSGVAELDGTVQTPTQPSQIPIASSPGGQVASPFPMVVLLPEKLAPDGTGWFVSPVQPTGSFTIGNLRPGHYTAFAVEHFDGNIWQNPDFQKEIQPEGIGVDLGEGDHKQIQLATISNDQIQQASARAGSE